ncbi:hypothetical protein BJ138DRAFT_978367, partial [Hygrophoropsis aurantiaca]
TGAAWVRELLGGHPVRFHNQMGMAKHVFRVLIHELRIYAGFSNSKHTTMEEQLAIFLRI